MFKRPVFFSLVITLILFLLGFVLLKIDQQLPVEPDSWGPLSLSEVVKAFETDGMSLNLSRVNLSSDFELNGIKPAVFRIDNTEDILFVYIYQSFEDRINVENHNNGMQYRDIFARYSRLQRFYPAKNALIVYAPKETGFWEALSQRAKAIDDLVFRLNDGKTMTFKGEGPSWEAAMVIKYYEHWWEDAGGRMHYDSWHTETPVLKYKGSDIESVGWIKYKYESPFSGGSGTGVTLDRTGNAVIGGGGGNGAINREYMVYDMTIEWSGRSESFTLFCNDHISPAGGVP